MNVKKITTLIIVTSTMMALQSCSQEIKTKPNDTQKIVSNQSQTASENNADETSNIPQQDWVQPKRSQKNIDALNRVQVKSYQFSEAGNINMEYGLYIPTTYNKDKKTPLVVALHGLGSGVKYMMEYNNLVELAEEYGYIVVTPNGYNWYGGFGAWGQGNDFAKILQHASPVGKNIKDLPNNLGELSEKDVLNVLDIVKKDYNIDENRTYLVGQSMGGAGVLHLVSKYPEKWTAFGAMAPGILFDMDAETLKTAKDIPGIMVAGDADKMIKISDVRKWRDKMKELQMNYEYIEVKGGTHGSAGRENIDKVFEFLSKQSK